MQVLIAAYCNKEWDDMVHMYIDLTDTYRKVWWKLFNSNSDNLMLGGIAFFL